MSMIMPSFDAFLSLNRTFYGIETIRIHVQLPLQCTVLIVPFMELKHRSFGCSGSIIRCLNRTFYGIETVQGIPWRLNLPVLIVPFMELKPLPRLVV